MKILIVEDIEDNRYLLETLLNGKGYQVVTAGDGIEALGKLKEELIDMIISDILMPGMDGFQLCRECKKDASLKEIPFVFYTATYTDKKDEDFALSLGAEKFITKPQESKSFLKILEEVIEKHKKGLLVAPREPIEDEEVYFKKYNKRLIQKLEQKMLDLANSEKHVRHLFSVLKAIRNVNEVIIREKERGVLLQKTCDALIEARGYNSAWIGLLKGKFNFSVVVGSPPKENVTRFCKQVLGDDHPLCIKKALNQKNQFMLINSYEECGDCILKDMHGIEQSTIIRLENNHKLIGLLAIMLAPDVAIDEEEKSLLAELSNDIAFGLRKIELEEKQKQSVDKLRTSYQRVKKTMEGTINVVGNIVEVKDPYTAGHQRNVSMLAAAIAREMDLTQNRIEGIRIASLLHDIGKISVPAEILNKSTKLSEIEFSLIKTHSQIGYDILESIKFSWSVAKIVLQHHERLDGSGYPQGLKGDKILLEAKIIGVADVVEAISSHRPYRPALGIDKALEEISQNKGILYDPEVVDTCVKLFKEKDYKY